MRGKTRSRDHIFLLFDEQNVFGAILPDGDTIYVSLTADYDELYKDSFECLVLDLNSKEKNDVA